MVIHKKIKRGANSPKFDRLYYYKKKLYKYKITVNARNIARFEFESWCQGVTSEFPEYSVKLDGVGFPASGQTSQGPCS